MTIGDLLVRVGANIDGYKSAMAEVPQIANTATGKVSGAVNSMTTSITASLASVGSKLASVGTMMTIGLTVPIVGLGAASIKAASEMESLKLALNAITHNAAETEKQMARLKEVAKIPGLDFQGAVKGSVNLQAAGFSATMAERALKAFGNALATVGKGREDLEGVNLVLTQILNKPKVMAQDLNQLRERLPQISGMMKAAFGSSVSEDIQKLGITGEQFVAKIITEFEKLPPVTSGLKNTFENVRDASFQALAKLGDNLAPIAMRIIDVVINPLITAVSKAADAFTSLPGPVQNAALGITAFLVVAGPAATIVGKLTTAVISLAGIYTTLSTLITARIIPALFGTQAAATAAQMGTAAMSGTFAAFGSTATAATTAATTATLSLGAALGGIVLILGGVVAGYIAWKNAQAQIKPLDTSRPEGALGENFTFSGFGATPLTPGKKAAANTPGWQYLKMQGGNAADYVTGLPAPRPGGGGLDPEKVKEAYSNLGIKDLEKDLAEATAAFNLLTAAHKLNDGQVIEATKHINDLRGSIAEMRAGYADVPKTTTDLLKTLGVDFDAEKLSKIQEMGAALTDLSQRVQAFVGPQQNGLMDGKLTEAWQKYAHAVATADDEMKKHIDDVPWLQYAAAVDTVDLSFTKHSSNTSLYIKTEADLNAEMKLHLDVLRELPEAHRPVMDVVMDAFGAVKGLTDAYHYFNIQTPADLTKHAAEAKRQYEIIKNAAGASAVATQIAWTKAMLVQIELDHQMEITDQELYEQRKRMAEDSLKHLEGESKKTGEVIKKDHYDLGKELEQMSHRTFDSMERDLARNIVQWKGWRDTVKNIGISFAEDFTAIMLKGLFKPLEDAFAGLAKKAGGILGGIFGGGPSPMDEVPRPGGGNTPSPGGGGNPGGGGASAASGLAGWVGAIGSVATAVSSIIGNFQNAHQETSLNAIEHNTRYLQIQFEQYLAEHYLAKDQLFLKLDDMWNEIRNVVSAVHNIAVPQMQMAGAPGVVNINVYGAADTDEVVNRVAAHLKRNGVYV